MDLTEAALMVGPVTGGFISAFKTSAAIRSDWYKTLQQPWFKPPDQVCVLGQGGGWWRRPPAAWERNRVLCTVCMCSRASVLKETEVAMCQN